MARRSRDGNQRLENDGRTSSETIDNRGFLVTNWGPAAEEFGKRLFQSVRRNEDVFYTSTSRWDETVPVTSTLNVAGLQRTRLHVMQWKIAKLVGDMYEVRKVSMTPDAEVLEDVDKILHNYCGCGWLLFSPKRAELTRTGNALRDLDYMKERAHQNYKEDPFQIKSSRAFERDALEGAGLFRYIVPPPFQGTMPKAKDSSDPKLSVPARSALNSEERMKAITKRISFAIGGVIAIFAPVVVMVLLPGRASGLATSFGSMLLVSLIIARWSALQPSEVLTFSAAYAAVLVVFIGTNNTPT